MYNSGLIAARAEHAPLLEDALVLIERLWAGGLKRHDIEQFAVSECFRLGGVPVAAIDREFEHYYPRWSKRYMRRRLRERSEGEEIAFSKTRVQAVQGDVEPAAGLEEISPPLKLFARATHCPRRPTNSALEHIADN